MNVVQGGKERLHSVGGFADEGNQDVPPIPLYSHPYKVGHSIIMNENLLWNGLRLKTKQKQDVPLTSLTKISHQNSPEYGFPSAGFQVVKKCMYTFVYHYFLVLYLLDNVRLIRCVNSTFLQKPKPSGDRATYAEKGIFGRDPSGASFGLEIFTQTAKRKVVLTHKKKKYNLFFSFFRL